MTTTLECLPVEIIADILAELDLDSLITASSLSKRIRNIVSDPALNPWRGPILRNIQSLRWEDSMKHLSVRSVVPRHNWIDILSSAPPRFLLFEATLPNLTAAEWEECFKRRFLPGWRRWKKDGTWKEAFIKSLLHRVWHRSTSTCTTDEAWTKYIVLNRNGSANEHEITSRTFNPLAIFNEMKHQSNLSHLETRVRLVLELADVRILAFGILNKPDSLTTNTNACLFLHPPGIEIDTKATPKIRFCDLVDDHGVYPMRKISRPSLDPVQRAASSYTTLQYPTPAPCHRNYPFYTPGGSDKRWLGSGELEEGGLHWVGGLMIAAQLIGPRLRDQGSEGSALQDLDLVTGVGRQQYASFSWSDLWAVAPWMEERVTKKIQGAGLGN